MKETKHEPTPADVVREYEMKGRVVVMTIEGLMSSDIDKFIGQPTDGILYDLNMDRATLLTMLSQDDRQAAASYINRYAAMLVIEALKKRLDEALQALRNADARQPQ